MELKAPGKLRTLPLAAISLLVFSSAAGAQFFYQAPPPYWHPRQHYPYPEFDRGWPGRQYDFPGARNRWRAPERERRAPAVRVEGPQYYDYRPDRPVNVSLAELARVETASTAQWQEPTGEFNEARALLASVSLRTLPEVGEAVVEHYSARPEFVWVKDGEISAKAEAALGKLRSADEYGLAPADYRVRPIAGEAVEPDERAKALIRFEMELSAAVLTYVLDAIRGRVDPNRISGYHDLPRHEVNLVEAMAAIADTDDVARYLDERHPNHSQFAALAAELARLRANEGSAPRFPADTFIRPGDVNPRLPQIVAAIRLSASNALKRQHAAALEEYRGTPEYGPRIVALIRDFQRERGLAPDGIIGRATINALSPVSPADRIKKLESALERLRWLPRELGRRYVLINQPAFVVDYVEDGKTVLSMRSVVGKKETQTYFFSDRIEYVEYNPNWNVPLSILVNQYVPRLLADPYYLDRKGYEVINAAGRRISSASVDWHRVARRELSVTVRQPPSDANALGALKIMFPNQHAIYMHDTPHRELFARKSRAFSNGCVRLEDARAMATALLGKDLGYVDSRIASGRTTADRLPDEVRVHVTYFTAWPDADGTIRYFDDVYDRDEYLARAIEATSAVRRSES